jgi:hypothetical protein|tara:strand:- start:906 stop:1295 length:390 start_codon:yes stop_codon:yes gene_type:complete
MTKTTSCKIEIFCEINPSEEKVKIETAILNIFSDLEISINEHRLIGKSKNTNTLSKIFKSIHKKNTKNVYQRILQRNNDGNSTWFYLNKQAAFVDTVAVCSESDESPLGPIKVTIEANDIENIIQTLTY